MINMVGREDRVAFLPRLVTKKYPAVNLPDIE